MLKIALRGLWSIPQCLLLVSLNLGTGLVFSQTSPPVGEIPPIAEPISNASIADSNEGQIAPGTVRFSFDRAAWRDVFAWLSNEAGLALHVSEIPSGTFTYADPKAYTPSDAIDRINIFLLPEGFSLVRSESLLSVINLRDARSIQRLDTIARTIEPSELDKIDDHEIVKCFFSLKDVTPADAANELTRLQLMIEPRTLDASRQIVVVDTVRKVRSVQQVLAAMESKLSEKQTQVRPFVLQHAGLEDVLTVARPHLGIEPGLMHSPEINISSDESGKKLFVSGTKEALLLFESLLKVVDVADASQPQTMESSVLRSHRVRDENLTMVYEVLQTVLVGKSIRLSMEPSTNSIVALADDESHKIIESTIQELEGLEDIFTIIPLQSTDPYFAITLLDEMFDLSSPATKSPNAKPVKVDADPNGMRLFVRGPKDKVEEIQSFIENLDRHGQSKTERVVPVFGAQAESALDLAKTTWDGPNEVVNDKQPKELEAEIIERTIHSEQESTRRIQQAEQEHAPESSIATKPTKEFVSSRQNAVEEASESIEARITDRGIVLQSNDDSALNRFESHLRSVANSQSASKVETIIYYLKYSTADEATHLLGDLLDGATTVAENSSSAKLVNGNVPSGKGLSFLGSYLRSNKGGATLVTSGTLTVIADARLNRLICVGTSSELALVEQYLKVIDKDASLTEIETYGVSHVIELKHAKASDIADVLRDTYGDRVALSTEQKNAQQAQRAAEREKGNATPENNIQASKNKEAKMFIAVHEISNSIVVTAPETLYRDVQKLVAKLDEDSEQAVEVIFYPNPQGIELLRETLKQNEKSLNRSPNRSR